MSGGTEIEIAEGHTATVTDRASWLDWRRSGVGGSDAPAVLGLSTYSSPFSVWADKVGLLTDDDPLAGDDPREFGRRAEVMLAPWFADVTGLHIGVEQMMATHREHSWMLATPDGAVFESPESAIDDALGGLEIKTDWGKPWDAIPAHHQAQGQWQMAVTGWPKIWFAVLHGRRFRTYELDRDDADIELMTERIGAFWCDHVLTGDPPPVDGHDATLAALAEIHPSHIPDSTVALDDHLDTIRDWVGAKTAKSAAAAREKSAKAVIVAALGDAYEGTLAGRRAVTSGTQTRKTTCKHCGAVDESAPFRVLRPTKEAIQ